jgi:polyferredoxin
LDSHVSGPLLKRDVKVGPIWPILRKIAQYVFLALFVICFLITRHKSLGNGWIDYFIRFDPLLGISEMLASRTFQVNLAIGAGAAIILALVAGRAWCGWLCPLGTVLDIFEVKKTSAHKIPENLRKTKYGLLLLILTTAFFGNLSLLFFDPITILFRSLTLSILPGLNQAFTALEKALYPIPLFQEPISWLESNLRPLLLPVLPQYFNQAVLFGLVFVGVIALNWLAARFWCRYICPLGGFLGIISKVAVLRRNVDEKSRGCSVCAKRCPTRTIDRKKGVASDSSECTPCFECFKSCADSTIKKLSPLKPGTWNSYDPGRRELFAAAVASITGVALFHSSPVTVHPPSRLLRPPGSTDQSILSACARCGVCMRACPTNFIQPAGTELGLERLWTPLLNPDLGYCDFNCNTCGQVCPVGAIPLLPLEEKQITVIGRAYIDQNRCLAWSDHKTCIVCEEMCPTPKKAVHLDLMEFTAENGEKQTIKVPIVDRQLCIGCGICEFKCPVMGDAAIRVSIANPTLFIFG